MKTKSAATVADRPTEQYFCLYCHELFVHPPTVKRIGFSAMFVKNGPMKAVHQWTVPIFAAIFVHNFVHNCITL